MSEQLASGGGAFLCGLAISILNYFISAKILTSNPNKYMISTAIRQILNIGLLIVCYYVGEMTWLPTTALLVGGVAGITIPSFFFTAKLVKLNQKTSSNTAKEEENNG